MSLSKDQTKTLVELIESADTDELDCDSCFDSLSELVDLKLSGQEIPASLNAVVRHLEQCACCNDEYNALLEALRGTAQD